MWTWVHRETTNFVQTLELKITFPIIWFYKPKLRGLESSQFCQEGQLSASNVVLLIQSII